MSPSGEVSGSSSSPSEGWVGEALRSARPKVEVFPRRFGGYVLLGLLGKGGIGAVYLAYETELHREVAIKLLQDRGGEGPKMNRLLREAQALATLDHPNVVNVFAVGEVDGQAYVAMQRVEGRTLRAWQGQQPRPGWRSCVEMYLQAGSGLAAAHDAGLVHRDFKPDNCMIDDKQRVRVLDFGLVRRGTDEEDAVKPPDVLQRARTEPRQSVALDQSLTDTGAVLGTPGYMSPEQMEGKEVDARSDQFSFCASLYEAVYGERPFEGRTVSELATAILDGHVRSGLPAGGAVPERLRRIVLRGLAAEPRERWASMEMLLVELRRLVAPSTRRWLALGVAGGMMAIGLGIAQYAEVGFRCEGAEAQLEGVWDETRKQEVEAAILGTDLIYAPGTWDRVKWRLDDYAEDWTTKHTEVCEATRVSEEQTEDAMTLRMGCLHDRKETLRATVGVLADADATVVENAIELVIGLPGLARCDDLEALSADVPPPEDPEVAREVEEMGGRLKELYAEEEAGRYIDALEQVGSVVERAEKLGYGPLVAEAKLRRGSLRQDNGGYVEAERDLLDAHEIAMEHRYDEVALDTIQGLTVVVGTDQERHTEGRVWGLAALAQAKRSRENVDLADSLTNLGGVLRVQGEYEEAKLHHGQALRIWERAVGADHPNVATVLNNLGNVLMDQGEYEQAKLHHGRALQIWQKALGAEHPKVAQSLGHLGIVLHALGEYEEAKSYHQQALLIREKTLGVDHPHVAMSLDNLGIVYRDQGEIEQAKSCHERSLRIKEKALGANHPSLAVSLVNLGVVLQDQGQHEQAKLYLERALRIDEKALGSEHPNVAVSLANLGRVAADQGEYEQARLHMERALRINEKTLGADHSQVALSHNNLGSVLHAQGEYEQAELHLEQALRINEKALGANHPQVALSHNNLGVMDNIQGKYEQAVLHHEQALRIWEKTLGTDHLQVAYSLLNLSNAFCSNGECEKAKPHYERALRIIEKALGADHPDVFSPLVGLANVALADKDFDAARFHAERAVSICDTNKVAPEELAEARFVLARALWGSRSERVRALSLAEKARNAYAEVGMVEATHLAEVEQWLREHRVR
ncbi:serine/threonine-protein kinase [Paraliomyxa miuraensis]|uniref:serine/threonine-protein kinase n=1 Tax=Paraliomyxa miuraensis TaxID=376150 RepID=UPI002256B4FD|nr:serine/threonine-protein kinase [Paraliomyxa miuraensis]MCX4239429.1 tetratricopeptide repeat protein [Paraliomyxa miuraensis]